jgi:hypothetical protein
MPSDTYHDRKLTRQVYKKLDPDFILLKYLLDQLFVYLF